MLKSKTTGSMQEVILPDFPDDENTTTVTKSRRVSFGTNIVKEFIVGSAVSTQCMLEYEQAFPSSDSSNADSSNSAIEGDALDHSAFVVPESQRVHKSAPPISQPSESDASLNRSKPPKFSSTICFSVDSPTADMEFTEGCLTLAKSILDKKNKEMTVIIQAKPKEEEKVKDEETKYFDGSQFDMSMTRCLKPKENRKEEKKLDGEKTKIFSKFEDEMSITRCNKVFNYEESDSSFDDCKENRMPLDMIIRHLDKDTSDLENDLFNSEKTLSNLLTGNPFDFSNDSEKLNMNESMEITAEIQQNVFKSPIDKLNENKLTGSVGSNESMEISCEFRPEVTAEPEKISNASLNPPTAKPENLLTNELFSPELSSSDLHFESPSESEDKIIDEKLAELKSRDEITDESMEISCEVLKEPVELPSFGEKTDPVLQVSTERVNESMDITTGHLPLQNDMINKSKVNEMSIVSRPILSETSERPLDLEKENIIEIQEENVESVETNTASVNSQPDEPEISEQPVLTDKTDQSAELKQPDKSNLNDRQTDGVVEFTSEVNELVFEVNDEVQPQPVELESSTGNDAIDVCSNQAGNEENTQETADTQSPVKTTAESVLLESMEITSGLPLKNPSESTEPDNSESEVLPSKREPSFVDVKVIENLEEQSKEPGCIWSLEDFQHPQTKSPGWLSFKCNLLESTARIFFSLKISEENSLFSCSSVTTSEVTLKEERQFRLPEYKLVIDFGFQELKKYFEQHREKVETIRLVPYFLDQLNSFIFKTNSYLRQIYLILTLYPGSRLTGSLLSFRLYSFPIFFSSLISIDLINLFRLSDCPLSVVNDFGAIDKNKILEIYQKCLKCENSLCDFVIQSTKYLVDLEKKTGCVSNRRHIKLLPDDLKL